MPEPGSPGQGEDLPRLAGELRGARGDALEPRGAQALEERDRAHLVRGHARVHYRDRAAIPAQRSQSGNHGAHERPQERQRPSVGDSTSTRSRATTRAAAASSSAARAVDRDAARARVLEREPAEDARLAPRLLRVLERGAAKASRVEQEVEVRPGDAVAGERERERGEQLEAVLVDGRVDERPRVREGEAAPALGETALHRLEAEVQGLQGLDGEPALEGPLPERDAVPRGERGVEVARVVDAEVRQARADPRLVDDPVAAEARRGAGRAARARPGRAPGSATPQPSPARTPTWPRSTSPKRPARPAIWASSHGRRSRRASPSNFVVSAKSSVSQGRFTPCPRTSVATQTSAAPERKRSISSRREASGIAP